MTKQIHEHTLEWWPREISFVPYVGRSYEVGLSGRRVLLLGESHYRSEGLDNDAAVTRTFTRKVFGDLEQPIRTPGAGRFFPPLDRLLTGMEKPTPRESADAWSRIAFCNLAQEFAGTRPGDRPSGRQLRSGSHVLVEKTLPLLRPDVVLVLGRRAWEGLEAGTKQADGTTFLANHVRSGFQAKREVWSLPYAGGSALMTWVYHPSRSIDRWMDMSMALRWLLALSEA